MVGGVEDVRQDYSVFTMLPGSESGMGQACAYRNVGLVIIVGIFEIE
jgi:hypothetical protein